jgi:hypothetical protein
LHELLPPDGTPYAVIHHHNLAMWIQRLRQMGYSRVVVIVPIREPIANVRSMMARGHTDDISQAYWSRQVHIARNIAEALAANAELEVITYEGLTEPFLREWLPRIGLEYVPGALDLVGQHAPESIVNQNSKHY